MSQTLVDDDLWSRIEPLLPKRRPRNRQHAGRKPIPDRAVLTGILFVLRSGIPWKMLPQEMGCGLEATPSGLAHGVAPTGPTRSGAGRRRQRLARGAARGKKAGPNPTDRRKAGSNIMSLPMRTGFRSSRASRRRTGTT
jgi:transposase